jgi:membrane associated rhomboid family serine protease
VVGSSIACSRCGSPVTLVSAEAIVPGAGAGDFDARLVITQGPAGIGQVLALGGVPDLELGTSTDRHIQLPGTMVSRAHARLSRLDFGPSRWRIEDTRSRNGLFVNDEQVDQVELQDGDRIQIGEYELRYVSSIPMPVMEIIPGGVICPGCEHSYTATTQVCITCGINLKTGRPLVTSRALDEDDLAVRTHNWIQVLSFLMWFGLVPIASEAFGTKRAKSIWWITGITVGVSLLFFIPVYSGHLLSSDAKQLMLWCGTSSAAADLSPIEMIRQRYQGQFAFYQLITSALIHANVTHLAGNLVFLLVFGIRVNELIGNVKMAIIYPILAVLSALVYMIASINTPPHSLLGASGAIMGLAGMYFVFFPVQKVVMLIWLRAGIIRVYYKIFRMSGFWLLILWVGLNDVLPTMLGSQNAGGVAHWAHLGGFISGMIIAIGLLMARQVNAHGSDVLSMAMGPAAWKIIGRPAAT